MCVGANSPLNPVGQIEGDANATILVFASSTREREGLCGLLERVGYRISAISDLQVALRSPLVDTHVVVVFNPWPHWRVDYVCEVCSAFERFAPKLPLLVVGPSDVDTKVKVFEAGADDYVVDPFDPPEFLARINSLIRRPFPGSS